MKKLFNISLLLIFGLAAFLLSGNLSVAEAQSPYCLPNDPSYCVSPVGEWRFEEGGGTVANDTSGAGKTAAVRFGNGGWTTGKIGGAFNFDGVMTGGTRVITNGSYVPPTKITLEAWVYPTAYVAGQGRIIAVEYNCTNPCVHLRLVPAGLKFQANWTTGSVTATLPTTAVPLNQWSYVAATYDGSSRTNIPVIYVNGLAQTASISNSTSGSYGNNSSPWGIGNDGGTNGVSAFAGKIDEARVYDYLRTGPQINLDMTYTPASTCTPNCTGKFCGSDGCGGTCGVCGVGFSCNPSQSACVDSQAPTPPGNLTASASSSTEIDLSWLASTDNVGVTGYNIFRNSLKISSVSALILNYADTGLTPATTYPYFVQAFDLAGNISSPSAIALATTLFAPDTTPPTVALTYPITGQTISNNIVASASASDNVAVAGVRFQVDGLNFGPEATTSPYIQNLDTTTLTDGSHVLTAVARDTSNNTAVSSPVTVTVNNTSRPNIVLIVDDDQRWDTMSNLPLTNSTLGAEGVQFDNFFVSTPLCCPSRSSILTGLYSHNTGVLQNFLPNGGATKFNDSQTIAVWLKKSGYRTGLVGKYLNDYIKLSPYIPPGWDNFQAFLYEDTIYYNFALNDNGVVKTYGSTPADYSTDVVATKAAQFIYNAPASQPLFLYFTPAGPHAPARPAPIDIGKYAGIAPWRPASFNEADVSDKPAWVQSLPLLSSTDIANIDSFRQGQLETLQSVDRAVKSVWDALASTGRLNNTVIIFLSDNGIAWGEHRILNNKECPYEECVRVPMLIRTPGGLPRHDAHLAENIDLAPTIADFAGVIPTSAKINGASFRPLLTNPSAHWRSEILLEELGTSSTTTTFQAVRNDHYIYIEYANGDRELYDLVADPYQLQNAINNPSYASVIPVMQALLANLKTQ